MMSLSSKLSIMVQKSALESQLLVALETGNWNIEDRKIGFLMREVLAYPHNETLACFNFTSKLDTQ